VSADGLLQLIAGCAVFVSQTYRQPLPVAVTACVLPMENYMVLETLSLPLSNLVRTSDCHTVCSGSVPTHTAHVGVLQCGVAASRADWTQSDCRGG
jgi:hypothetical protein